MAWPSCMPKIAPPMFCSIEDAPPIMDFISSGICSVMAAESALAMLLATGSVSRFQVPRVSSTHSARDQARPIRPVAGRSGDLVEPQLGEPQGLVDLAGLLRR